MRSLQWDFDPHFMFYICKREKRNGFRQGCCDSEKCLNACYSNENLSIEWLTVSWKDPLKKCESVDLKGIWAAKPTMMIDYQPLKEWKKEGKKEQPKYGSQNIMWTWETFSHFHFIMLSSLTCQEIIYLH